MSQERLSKLQKWLLLTLFDSKGDLTRRQIFWLWWTQFKGESRRKFPGWRIFYNKGQVTLTRSIDSLYYKGYVELMSRALVVARHSTYGKDDPQLAVISAEAGKMIKLLGQAAAIGAPGVTKVWLINLTDKGLEKAKELK